MAFKIQARSRYERVVHQLKSDGANEGIGYLEGLPVDLRLGSVWKVDLRRGVVGNMF